MNAVALSRESRARARPMRAAASSAGQGPRLRTGPAGFGILVARTGLEMFGARSEHEPATAPFPASVASVAGSLPKLAANRQSMVVVWPVAS